jgi:cyclopropane fatty-acyl-phospholipid synthase-like methyltransferase
MDPILPSETSPQDDWDRMYREGLPPWETGKTADELARVLREHRSLIAGPTAIELGSGTGADAIYLAKARFDVTAVEISPIAMERARARAEMAGAAVHFVLDDVFKYAETAGKFDLIYDAGFYDYVRRKNLARLLDVLWRLSRPGSIYLTLAGNSDETDEDGPPGVTERDIQFELGRLFEMVELRSCRLASPRRAEGYLGWSCLMRRPQPVGR